MNTETSTPIYAHPTEATYSVTEQEGNKFIKVPLLMLGTWQHEVYGEVKFDQTDFDDVLNNFEQSTAGYEPPLFKGHPQNTETVEGAPSEGWPEAIFQENDLLYGLYKPTDPNLYTEVENKVFRYSSAEVVRNAKDKSTGENVGTMLVGCALTNRPFLPFEEHELQVVRECFSDDLKFQTFSFEYTPTENTMTTQTIKTQEPKVEASEGNTSQGVNKLSDPITAVANIAATVGTATVQPALSEADFASLAANYAALSAQNEELKEQIGILMSERAAVHLSDKLSKLEALNLPKETKQKFADMINAGNLSGEAEAALFGVVEQFSTDLKAKYTERQGAQTQPPANKMELSGHFAKVYEQNMKQAQAARGQQNL